jgi:hypothetical protein
MPSRKVIQAGGERTENYPRPFFDSRFGGRGGKNRFDRATTTDYSAAVNVNLDLLLSKALLLSGAAVGF